jgi:ketosteroid isomerase-like protein
MKNYSCLLFLLLTTHSFAQTSTESDEKQVRQLIQDSFDGIFSAFDSDLLPNFYTPDFLLFEQGEIWDMAFIQNYLTRAKANPNPSIRTNRFEFIQTKVEGNRAWVGYWNYATITRDGEVIRDLKWLESATAVKTDAGWRLDMLHSTRVEKP